MRKLSRGAYEDTKGFVRFVEAMLEILVLTLLYYVVWRNGYPAGLFPEYFHKGKYVLMGLYGILAMIFFWNSDCTKFGQLRKMDLAIGQVIALCLVNFVTYFQLSLIANRMISVAPVLMLTAVEVVAAVVLITLYDGLYYKLYTPHNMLLIYGSKSAVGLKFKMDSRKEKYQVAKIMSVDAGYEQICKEIPKYESVILNDVPAQIRNDILKYCYLHRVRTYVAPKLTDIMLRGGENNTLFDTPLLLVKGTGLTPVQRITKRAMDILLSLIALIVASPIMVAVAIAIKLEDGGPVFYKQKRVTRNGCEFEILKFRSMIVDAEKDGQARPATDRDPRITRVGNVIRAIRVDELPQILNLLKGDMSIVGPRPERIEHVEEYCKDMPEFKFRLKVRGGLTGYAQIYGKYNTSPYDKLRLDLMYIENYSLLMDIKLILMTVRILFKKESTEGFDKQEELKRLEEEILNAEAKKEDSEKI